ncbi:hypothetical protein DBR06_SOUSAS29010013, partial [Sousa chinensis]
AGISRCLQLATAPSQGSKTTEALALGPAGPLSVKAAKQRFPSLRPECQASLLQLLVLTEPPGAGGSHVQRIFLSCPWASQACDPTLVKKDPHPLSSRQLLQPPNGTSYLQTHLPLCCPKSVLPMVPK